MTEGIHFDVDHESGRLRLLCNAAQFNRLSSWLRQEADLEHLITVPATEIRVVSVELVTEEEAPPGVGKQLAAFGCAIAIAMTVAAAAVGVWTMVRWVLK